ncbi:MAG: DEAD/DEAH box helicase [Acidimicrobiales bacterium]
MDRKTARQLVRRSRRLKADANDVLAAIEEARADAHKVYADCLKQAAKERSDQEQPAPGEGLEPPAARDSARPVRVRFDVERKPREQTKLLAALAHYDRVQRLVDDIEPRLSKLIDDIDDDLDQARVGASAIKWRFARSRKRKAAQTSLRELRGTVRKTEQRNLDDEVTEALRAVGRSKKDRRDPWDEFQKRPVVFNELLIDIGGLQPDIEAAKGYLPSEIVESIEAFNLDTSLLVVSLRGYQRFGAAFALVQQRVILGDEMGLGKTVEALAVIAHLRATGSSHFVIVSPASVLANWHHEILRHTDIDEVTVLHGPDRDDRLDRWATEGGVALTTFGTVGSLRMPAAAPAVVIVDEAHYIKNPDAKRTQAVRQWLMHADRVLLMTGTPMENRLEEFENLVGHVNPAVARQMEQVYQFGSEAFRRSLAPVYLRRNQVDVLDELPDRIEAAEWVTLEGRAARSYQRSVADGNFMAMRRAAFMTPDPADSPKLQRLLEIVDEAMENDRKVVVFSYFLDVIDRVANALGEHLAGTLTGQTRPAERQAVIDEFTARQQPGVLVAQIEAAGVGLNIQTASVVILTEPQWKPSTEEQAIARCHRMGQVRAVEVHRLLTEDSIDELMVAALADKSALFAEYVRKSALRDASAAAVDGTDSALFGDNSTLFGADGPFSMTSLEQHIIEWERARLEVVGSAPPAASSPMDSTD